jgi:hypothetical protein
MRRSILALTWIVTAGIGPALAQAPQGSPPPVWPAPPQQLPPATLWPDPPKPPPQAAPAPPRQTPPPRAQAPAARPPAAATPHQPRPKPAERTHSVTCAGPFARTANHAQLEAAFGAKNVVFTQVDAPGGTKLNASVVFPDDPKRRLEVLWHDEAARARPSAIVITGASRWLGPRGVRLGLAMAEIEKRNGKPFRLSGFGGDYGGSVADWDGGKLDQLGGACRMGMRFVADAKAAPEALAKVGGDQPFSSNDAEMRTVKPRVSEIIVGYGE